MASENSLVRLPTEKIPREPRNFPIRMPYNHLYFLPLPAIAIMLAAAVVEARADIEWEYSSDQGWNLEAPYEPSPPPVGGYDDLLEEFSPYYGGFANRQAADYAEDPQVVDYSMDYLRDESGRWRQNPNGDRETGGPPVVQRNPGGGAEFQGRLASYQRVELEADGETGAGHSFVRLSLQDGRSRIIGLGTEVDVSDLDLPEGEYVAVHGRQLKIDGLDILVADRFQTGIEILTIDERNQYQSEHAEASIRGVLRNYRKLDVGSLVHLVLRDGRSYTVDPGETSPGELDIEPGARIRIEGSRRTRAGRQIIVANRIIIDGSTTLAR